MRQHMTFEQFLESHGLEEDFKDSGMTPEEFLESIFEEKPVRIRKPVHKYENIEHVDIEDLF